MERRIAPRRRRDHHARHGQRQRDPAADHVRGTRGHVADAAHRRGRLPRGREQAVRAQRIRGQRPGGREEGGGLVRGQRLSADQDLQSFRRSTCAPPWPMRIRRSCASAATSGVLARRTRSMPVTTRSSTSTRCCSTSGQTRDRYAHAGTLTTAGEGSRGPGFRFSAVRDFITTLPTGRSRSTRRWPRSSPAPAQRRDVAIYATSPTTCTGRAAQRRAAEMDISDDATARGIRNRSTRWSIRRPHVPRRRAAAGRHDEVPGFTLQHELALYVRAGLTRRRRCRLRPATARVTRRCSTTAAPSPPGKRPT